MKLRILSETEALRHDWLSDHIGLHDNHSSSVSMQFGGRQSNNSYSFLTDEKRILGSMKIKHRGETIQLSNIRMDDEIRRDHTTHTWFNYIEKWAKKNDVEEISVKVREDDKTLLVYCKSIGFIKKRSFRSLPLLDNQVLTIYEMVKFF